jgi:hypothetical protein
MNGIDQNLFGIIDKHFSRLRLIDRYQERFSFIYADILTSVFALNSSNPNLISGFLSKSADSIFASKGRNNHLGIILQNLANHQHFINLF